MGSDQPIDLNSLASYHPSVDRAGTCFAETYRYDDRGRRIAKITNGTRTDYLDDGLNITLEVNGSWSTPTARVTHAGLDTPLLRATASQTQAYTQDGFNSAVLTTDATTGAVLATQRFDAWGNKTAGSGTVPLYGYSGREPDSTGLTYMRARTYDPSIGRFTQADPLGFIDGVNAYAYARNNPINRSDPLGTLSQPSTGAGGSYFGNTLTRLGGAAQALGGVAEIGVGIVAGAAVGAVTGGLPGVLVAAAPVVHGLDTLQAGLRTAYHGESVTSVTAQSLQALGLSATQAGWADAGIGVALSLGGGAAPRIASGLLGTAADTGALVSRANEVHSALHPITQEMRTTAVLETNGGRIVAGGGADLAPAQRALLGPSEVAAKLPGAHAEITALEHAAQSGLTPQAIGVTRTICPECEAAIRASGGTLTSPTTAVWPR